MRTADVTPVERAAWIVDRLHENGELSTREIAERCEVSIRTVQRDLLAMERIVALVRQDGLVRLMRPQDG